MGRSPGFGSTPADSSALFGLGFPPAAPLKGLASPAKVTPRLIMQKARRQAHAPEGTQDPPTDCRRQVSGSFHSPSGVLFTFPSRYFCPIGRRDVFSLGRWSARIPTGFPVPRGTREHNPGSPSLFAYGTVTLCGPAFQHGSAKGEICNSPRGPPAPSGCAPQPRCRNGWRPWHDSGLGCSPFARRYSGNRCLFLFLRVLRCFTSPGVASMGYSGEALPPWMTRY